jgi:hypoxia up-regulated 1
VSDLLLLAGAALYGAGITRGFRTKDIRVHDITPYGIDVSYEADKASEGESPLLVYSSVALTSAFNL